MPKYFVDLHVHIGATSQNKPVKITASPRLTFLNIIKECVERKGIDMVGIVDCASPGIREDIKNLFKNGELEELSGGGWRYRNKVTIIPGVEVESSEKTGGRGHFLSFFPGLKELEVYSSFLNKHIKNLHLSTQQSYLTAQELLRVTQDQAGIFIPAHVFTPYKSLYGSCGSSLKEVFPQSYFEIKTIELGLSSDTQMADTIYELRDVTFLSNSDAHSLDKIGREYNLIEMEDATFQGLKKALRKEEGKVLANYGLDPKLGKYHQSFCEHCQKNIPWLGTGYCPLCNGTKIVKGVRDRILEISNGERKSPPDRPPYIHQIPLLFLPQVGKSTLNKLLAHFGTEMQVLHYTPYEELEKVVGGKIASLIILSREGKLSVVTGGGGIYGKVVTG